MIMCIYLYKENILYTYSITLINNIIVLLTISLHFKYGEMLKILGLTNKILSIFFQLYRAHIK